MSPGASIWQEAGYNLFADKKFFDAGNGLRGVPIRPFSGYPPPVFQAMLALIASPDEWNAVLAAPGEAARPTAAESRELVLLVYRQMRALAGPRPDLDDLVQTALEQLLKANFEGRSRYSTFVHAVCYRVWLKHLRSAYRFRAIFSYFGGREEDPEPIEHRTPAANAEAAERLRVFYRALDQLSPKRRAVVALRDLGAEEIPAIAQIVGTNEATVRTRLRDGRAQLRQILASDPLFADLAVSAPSEECDP